MAVEVRLQGSSKPNEGYIEIKPSNGTWGGICDDFFDKSEADVICRMAGYPHGAEFAWQGTRGGNSTINHSFGHGSGSILLDDVYCNGNEDSILQCTHKEWGDNNCHDGHTKKTHEWAGVTCLVHSYFFVRLLAMALIPNFPFHIFNA